MVYERETRRPSEVGGWLLFFCVILTFLLPAGIVYTIIEELRSGLDLVTVVLGVVYLALAIFSFIAGLSLWRVRPNAVTTAKLFLITQATFALALYVDVLLGGNVPLALAPGVAMGILVRPLLFGVAWYLYLTKSRRVQTTYPRDYSVVTEKL